MVEFNCEKYLYFFLYSTENGAEMNISRESFEPCMFDYQFGIPDDYEINDALD
jgi:hypothetical protein